jgi:hypothetical protein
MSPLTSNQLADGSEPVAVNLYHFLMNGHARAPSISLSADVRQNNRNWWPGNAQSSGVFIFYERVETEARRYSICQLSIDN